MAKQEGKTNEEQKQQSPTTQKQQSQAISQQSPQGTGTAQGSSQGGLERRGGYNVLGLSLTPVDFLRLSPFSLMRRLTDELDRVFGELGSASATTVWTPAIEISKRDSQYVVRAELPGLKPDEVRVELNEDSIVLEGERKFEHEEEAGNVYRSERRYGHFYRAIPLPEGANINQARASFDNGVLEVTVPVEQPKSTRREIPVESVSAGSAGTQKKEAA